MRSARTRITRALGIDVPISIASCLSPKSDPTRLTMAMRSRRSKERQETIDKGRRFSWDPSRFGPERDGTQGGVAKPDGRPGPIVASRWGWVRPRGGRSDTAATDFGNLHDPAR